MLKIFMINKKTEITKHFVLSQVEIEMLSKDDLMEILKYQPEDPKIKQYISELEDTLTFGDLINCCQTIRNDDSISFFEIPYYTRWFPHHIPMDLIRHPEYAIFYPEETILIWLPVLLFVVIWGTIIAIFDACKIKIPEESEMTFVWFPVWIFVIIWVAVLTFFNNYKI